VRQLTVLLGVFAVVAGVLAAPAAADVTRSTVHGTSAYAMFEVPGGTLVISAFDANAYQDGTGVSHAAFVYAELFSLECTPDGLTCTGKDWLASATLDDGDAVRIAGDLWTASLGPLVVDARKLTCIDTYEPGGDGFPVSTSCTQVTEPTTLSGSWAATGQIADYHDSRVTDQDGVHTVFTAAGVSRPATATAEAFGTSYANPTSAVITRDGSLEVTRTPRS